MPNRKQIRRATRQRTITFYTSVERPGADGPEDIEVEIVAEGRAGYSDRDPQEEIDAEIELVSARAQDPFGVPIARGPWLKASVPYTVPIVLTREEEAAAEEQGLERLAEEATEDYDDCGPDRYDD